MVIKALSRIVEQRKHAGNEEHHGEELQQMSLEGASAVVLWFTEANIHSGQSYLRLLHLSCHKGMEQRCKNHSGAPFSPQTC